MSVHKGHRQRVKSKFIESGFSSFFPHEILEFLLFYSTPRKDTNPIAHNLIKHYGDLSAVFDASYDDLLKIDGVTENTATLIKAIPALSRVYLENKDDTILLNSSESCGSYFMPKFIGELKEVVYVAMLDNKLSVIKTKLLFEGSVNSAHIDIRRIVEECIKYNAASLIISHNHPNGVALPSSADIHTTLKIKSALTPLNINLIDHIVVAGNDFVSMADSGYL